MSLLKSVLGDELLSKDGEKVQTSSTLPTEGVVMFYFSAHWCPPCRKFTPTLSQFYTNFKTTNVSNDKKLEIVFISSDRTKDEFSDYYKEMPFLALPFEERERKAQLSKKYKVQGIPTLIVLNAKTGDLITDDGRSCVAEDPEAKDYPWVPKKLCDIFTGALKSKEGDTTVSEVVKDKVVGLYFSAHWCPPCRSFTPILKDTYNKIKSDGKQFEIVFVSSDRSKESFDEYFGEMPWYALPYEDSKKKKELSQHFDVQGIPTLVLLNKDLELITKNGRSEVMSDKEAKEFPWYPKPLNRLCENNATVINEGAAFIYFTGCGEKEGLKAQLFPLAESYVQQHKLDPNAVEELTFLFEENEDDEELCESLRNYCNLPEYNPLVVILDVPENKKFILPEAESSKENIEKMVEDFKNKKLKFTPIR